MQTKRVDNHIHTQYIYIHAHTHLYIHLNVHTHIYIYVYLHIYTYIHTHTHAHYIHNAHVYIIVPHGQSMHSNPIKMFNKWSHFQNRFIHFFREAGV